MPARKPGGKYKGKIGRAKGEATIAAELEARRRRAYEENLRRLQERRAQELLAEQGLQSEEDQAMDLKLQKLAQMFGSGKKATVKKFFKNWKIGIVHLKREAALRERQNAGEGLAPSAPRMGKLEDLERRTSTIAMSGGSLRFTVRTGGGASSATALHREDWGEELHPRAAAADRHLEVNAYRKCSCCNCDTGIPGLGCRSWEQLTEPGFESPFRQEQKELGRVQFTQDTLGFASGRSASTPSLGFASPRHSMTESAYENMHHLRSLHDVPEYDPTMPYVLSPQQEVIEERRRWITNLQNTAGSAERRLGVTLGSGSLGALPPLTNMTIAPKLTAKKKPLEQVAHWRTGQKTMLDRHMMKMYVVGGLE
eukprot:CAMPEP_0169420198 /NCGR_PEP_ID=MMETSP1017-20121227/65405_1 /TAXON_ID=342587 /ORGANISM="Karlodinium micrum, Strain CCMP2283" /LENGTH=367 /DNA_ID=CAMNT_0009528951 /DNA_START=73 /DNA_END=1178 /DNA_ORIENTATION=+